MAGDPNASDSFPYPTGSVVATLIDEASVDDVAEPEIAKA